MTITTHDMWLAATDEYPGSLEVTAATELKEVLNSATRRRVFNTYLSLGWYERLTRHILGEMPGRADLTLRLDAARAVLDVVCKRSAAGI